MFRLEVFRFHRRRDTTLMNKTAYLIIIGVSEAGSGRLDFKPRLLFGVQMMTDPLLNSTTGLSRLLLEGLVHPVVRLVVRKLLRGKAFFAIFASLQPLD